MAVVDVRLPRSHAAVFPDRCVVCDRGSPGSHVRLKTGTDGWWTWFLVLFAKPMVTEAPACRWCAWRLHTRRLISLLVSFAICGAAIWFIWPYLKAYVPRSLRSVVGTSFAIMCLVPQFIVEFFFAKALHVEVTTESVTYEFASRDYAIDFMLLNRDAPWVKFEGERIGESDAEVHIAISTSDGSYRFMGLAPRGNGGAS